MEHTLFRQGAFLYLELDEGISGIDATKKTAGMAESTVRKIIRHAEKNQLITRTRDPKNETILKIHFTPKGLEVREKLLALKFKLQKAEEHKKKESNGGVRPS